MFDYELSFFVHSFAPKNADYVVELTSSSFIEAYHLIFNDF